MSGTGRAIIGEAPTRTIKRSEITFADYNPRYIDEAAKKRLEKGMKRFGIVGGLVWNERTGTLVSGHQRLAILDKARGYPDRGDYEVAVSVVNLKRKDEVELNVQLNNAEMQGDFDFDALRDLTKFEIELDELGFSESGLDFIFGEGLKDIAEDSPKVYEDKEKLDAVKNVRENMNAQKAEENSADYYFTVVCDSSAEKAAMFERMGIEPGTQYVPSAALMLLAKKEPPPAEEPAGEEWPDYDESLDVVGDEATGAP